MEQSLWSAGYIHLLLMNHTEALMLFSDLGCEKLVLFDPIPIQEGLVSSNAMRDHHTLPSWTERYRYLAIVSSHLKRTM